MEPIVAEEWRPVVGLDSDFSNIYEVSNLGRVRSLDRCIEPEGKNSYFRKGTILKPSLQRSGYYLAALRNSKISKYVQVHSLVAFAWLEPCPGVYGQNKGQYHIDHIDHNRTNNRADNLQWLPAETNSAQGALKGENNRKSTLKNHDVIAIRSSNLSYKELANTYNVDISTIRSIISGTTWKHLDYPDKEKQISKRKTGISKLSQEEILRIILDNRPIYKIAKDYKVSSYTISKLKKSPREYLINI